MRKKPRIRQKIRIMRRALRMERREHKSSFYVYFILRILVILMMVLQFFNKNYENVFLCILTLLLLTVPSFIQVNFKVELPTGLEITILFFVFAAEILGEISAYYIKFPMWDTILHTINGFLMAAIGFYLVDFLNRNTKTRFNLSPAFLSLVAFCFSMTIGVIWEMFEWAMDHFLGFDMQKDTVVDHINSVALDPTKTNTVVRIEHIKEVVVNGKELGVGGYLDIGLHDTMKDLTVNLIGAVVFSVIGFIYVKNRDKSILAKSFIPVNKTKDKDYLQQSIEIEEKEEEERLEKQLEKKEDK
ncbi:MAG TPA: hypothetical protein H9887_06335 [Candidatus Dorea intestinavium]|nr:hypothetical protein [Candidatus Dorea intestinavium]